MMTGSTHFFVQDTDGRCTKEVLIAYHVLQSHTAGHYQTMRILIVYHEMLHDRTQPGERAKLDWWRRGASGVIYASATKALRIITPLYRTPTEALL